MAGWIVLAIVCGIVAGLVGGFSLGVWFISLGFKNILLKKGYTRVNDIPDNHGEGR